MRTAAVEVSVDDAMAPIPPLPHVITIQFRDPLAWPRVPSEAPDPRKQADPAPPRRRPIRIGKTSPSPRLYGESDPRLVSPKKHRHGRRSCGSADDSDSG